MSTKDLKKTTEPGDTHSMPTQTDEPYPKRFKTSVHNEKAAFERALQDFSFLKHEEAPFLNALLARMGLQADLEDTNTGKMITAMEDLEFTEDLPLTSIRAFKSPLSVGFSYYSHSSCTLTPYQLELEGPFPENVSELKSRISKVISKVTHIDLPVGRVNLYSLTNDGRCELSDSDVMSNLKALKQVHLKVSPSKNDFLGMMSPVDASFCGIIPKAVAHADLWRGGVTPGMSRLARWSLVFGLSFLASKLRLEISKSIAELGIAGPVDELIRLGRCVTDPFKEPVPYDLLETSLLLRHLMAEWVDETTYKKALASLKEEFPSLNRSSDI